ncbi:putative transcriptional regulator, Crp/Fnr family [Thiomonas sp. X19]|uniref:Crp/Fnr family transcriptional regulator n=1 Tax=Thiomonas sp. X19 TaxID=1050370 RepID=UPI000B6F5A56|nr:Crp/Fnr family transcriptional regulator [Thiomonas sp. X19]SCC95587.1 putative transcriptional regulator, Crp/Fnr family [Thiomonas sp. X19]
MKPRDYTEFTQSCPWMAELQDSERLRVHHDLRVQVFEPGAPVCQRGQSAEHWVGVLSGLVKVSSVSLSGKTITYTGVAPGGWFGEGTLLKRDVWKYDVIALRKSRIGLLPAETFFWLLDRSLAFNHTIVNQLNERLGQFIGQLQIDRLAGSDERVAHTLAAMFHPVLYPGVGQMLRVTQEELGYLCGLSRQRVNQALQRLSSLGLLRLRYGGIEVPDAARLRAFESSHVEVHETARGVQRVTQHEAG